MDRGQSRVRRLQRGRLRLLTRVYRGEERTGLIYFDDDARPAPYDFVPTLTAADQYPRLRGIIMGGSVEQLVSRVEAAMQDERGRCYSLLRSS